MDANEVNDLCNSCLAWEVKWNGEDDEEALAAMDETCGWNMGRENYREYRDVTAPDDKDKFLRYVEAYNPLTFGCEGYLYPSRFYVVCHASAVNIAKALLRGDSGFKVKLNVPFEGGYPLHRAAANFSYDLLELLLAHGARTDVRTEGPDSVADLLPLNVAIEDTCLQLECWTEKDCVLRLILLLSLPEMKMFLDCISLLARHTDQTFKELLNYVEQGKLLQTALLFVAAHKQIRAITLQDKDGKSMSAVEVILRRIDDVVLFLHRETGKIPLKTNDGFSLKKCKWKMAAMASARIIFQLIEKIGDSLDEFRQNVHSEVSHEEAVEYATSLFAREGFLVNQIDTDLSNVNWCCYPDDKQVEKSKGLLVNPPQPDCDRSTHISNFEDLRVFSLKSLRYRRFKRFVPMWKSVLSSDILASQPIGGYDNVGYHGFNPLNGIWGNKGRAQRAMFPLSKIESRIKLPVLPMGKYQLGRQYSTVGALISRVIRRV